MLVITQSSANFESMIDIEEISVKTNFRIVDDNYYLIVNCKFYFKYIEF